MLALMLAVWPDADVVVGPSLLLPSAVPLASPLPMLMSSLQAKPPKANQIVNNARVRMARGPRAETVLGACVPMRSDAREAAQEPALAVARSARTAS
ncbi:MAG TPA: hypothetical protein VG755_00680 [Nannocystaceae bacterium]|nr:hypothetical protein [Nannocystaceae bacterium]